MNKHQESTRFLIGFLAVVVACLTGMSVWFLSQPTVVVSNGGQDSEPAVRGRESVAQTPSDHGLDSQSRIGSRTVSTGAKPIPIQFAQYDRRPEGYAGTSACGECHQSQHESYLLTHHSRSLREVELDPSANVSTLEHPLSKRSYDVFQKDGRLWHREWRHFSEVPDDRIKTGELPVCYVMGSGAFGLGYLLGDGDDLLQSPVTWYVGSDSLGMAPGYDRIYHVGFTRAITAECMFCHAGLLSQREENPNHVIVHEMSIGCERCHGPGEAHVRRYREMKSKGGGSAGQELDNMIVHPGKLDRRHAESICGQCHLHGDIVVHAPGRQIWDFLPGEDLADTRLHYKHDKAGEFKDSFTGHFDQMWQSECYLQSETLTCITCHNPHQAEIVDLVALRREQCNRCHGEDHSCGLLLEQRLEQADNRCTQCHMPAIKTDVPHTSTTSHLIAVYDDGRPRGIRIGDRETLRRVQRQPVLSDQLLNRADSLAKAMWAVEQAREGDYQWLDSPVLDEELRRVLRDMPEDATTYSLLARMNRLRADRLDPTADAAGGGNLNELWGKVEADATRALQLESAPTALREAALESLGNQKMQEGDYVAAARTLTELSGIRRSAVDWYNLGLCYGKLGRLESAEKAFREAIRLDGNYAAPYRSLSILYRNVDPAASQQLAAIAQRLMSQ